MREAVTGAELTKDVRTSEGWRIGINLFETVQVYHQRREQSADLYNCAVNHFELEYEVRMTFDRGMSDLHATSLRVLKLDVADTMEPERRSELQSKLMGDLIVL
jgi:hypothetical protein